jgi:hypothetical protein
MDFVMGKGELDEMDVDSIFGYLVMAIYENGMDFGNIFMLRELVDYITGQSIDVEELFDIADKVQIALPGNDVSFKLTLNVEDDVPDLSEEDVNEIFVEAVRGIIYDEIAELGEEFLFEDLYTAFDPSLWPKNSNKIKVLLEKI